MLLSWMGFWQGIYAMVQNLFLLLPPPTLYRVPRLLGTRVYTLRVASRAVTSSCILLVLQGGECASIPAIPGETLPSKRYMDSLCAKHYAVVEQDGYIWVWAGNTLEADPSLLQTQRAGEKTLYVDTKLDYNVDWSYVVENNLDSPHIYWWVFCPLKFACDACLVPAVRLHFAACPLWNRPVTTCNSFA